MTAHLKNKHKPFFPQNINPNLLNISNKSLNKTSYTTHNEPYFDEKRKYEIRRWLDCVGFHTWTKRQFIMKHEEECYPRERTNHCTSPWHLSTNDRDYQRDSIYYTCIDHAKYTEEYNAKFSKVVIRFGESWELLKFRLWTFGFRSLNDFCMKKYGLV